MSSTLLETLFCNFFLCCQLGSSTLSFSPHLVLSGPLCNSINPRNVWLSLLAAMGRVRSLTQGLEQGVLLGLHSRTEWELPFWYWWALIWAPPFEAGPLTHQTQCLSYQEGVWHIFTAASDTGRAEAEPRLGVGYRLKTQIFILITGWSYLLLLPCSLFTRSFCQ